MADFLFKPTLKLLIDRSTNKVLFGEANKDMVDFLFAILAYSLGRATELLTPQRMAGSIGNLYKSLEDLPNEFVQPNTDKNIYLKPKLSSPKISPASRLLGLQEEPAPFSCSRPTSSSPFESSSSSLFGSSSTPAFGSSFSTAASFVASSSAFGAESIGSSGDGKGCVRDAMRYTVMDNLEVKPLSSVSIMALLNKFQVKDFSALVEKEVEVSMREGLGILKASLESTTVLNDVFGEKPTSVRIPVPTQI